jgi:hypothetical protein
MTIANYGELKSEVTKLLFHSRLVASYDLYAKMFEADANARLRLRQQEAVVPLTTLGGETGLPADYLAWRTVLPKYQTPAPGAGGWITTNPRLTELDYVHPAYLPPVGYGLDRVFTIEGGKFKARPVDDRSQAYELHYYQKLPTLLGSDGTSNWLLTEYPNAYLFGMMVEALGAQRNVEAATLYKQRRDEVLAEAIKLSSLTTGATSPKVRVAEYF